MSKNKRGCHVRSRISFNTYTFKWSFEHFPKLSLGKKYTSPDFYPCSSIRCYSTLKKSSSFLEWIMYNCNPHNAVVKHKISIVDTSGKLWIKKELDYYYGSGKRILEQDTSCCLIDKSDAIDTSDMYRLEKDGLTFSCVMTFVENDIESQTFDLKTEDAVDGRRNLEKLSNDLKTMYGVSLYTDVCLRVGSDFLRAHKAILCGRSPVFAKMFEHKLEEKETSVIDVVDIEMDALKGLISFLYTASVPNENFDYVFDLYYAADKYNVEDLRKLCSDILLSKLTIRNACRVLALADRHSDHTFKDSVMTFINIHLKPILVTEEWSNLVKEETNLAAEIIQKYTEDESQKITEEEEIDTEEEEE